MNLVDRVARSDMVIPMWIGGSWTHGWSDATVQILDPATGNTVARTISGGHREAAAAVRAARRAFDKTNWSRSRWQERSRLLRSLADLVASHAEELAYIETVDTGKTISESRAAVGTAAARFEYYAELVGRMPINNGWRSRSKHFVVHEPIGVVAQIIPWNYPIMQAAGRIAAAITAGASCVLKPSELAPLSTIALAHLIEEAEVPAGVVNVVTGSGRSLGRELVRSPGVDMVAFIGSTACGQEVMREAAATVKKVTLELGGKSPNIVFADADHDAALPAAITAIYANAGQNCAAGSILLIQAPIYDEYVAKLTAAARQLRVGSGLRPDNQMGPLISADQLRRVEDLIDAAVVDGATVASGGRRLSSPRYGGGYFLEPTVLTDVSIRSRAAEEEFFGPVLAVLPFEGEEEAVAMANSTKYGLAAAVWTANQTKGRRVVSRLKAGITWLNAYGACPIDAPWGGYKQSGIGRILGKYEVEEYLETKQVNVG